MRRQQNGQDSETPGSEKSGILFLQFIANLKNASGNDNSCSEFSNF